MTEKLKVLIVDKSPVVQRLLSWCVNTTSDMVAVGVATDPYIAREKIKQLEPDVITLDVNLPKMDGIAFLRNIMRLRPMPVVMVVDDEEESLALVDSARKIGAKGVFVKTSLLKNAPEKIDVEAFLSEIRNAARVKNIRRPLSDGMDKHYDADAVLKFEQPTSYKSTERIIAIGASTGGTEAIRKLLVDLPKDMPAIVIAQHIPGNFSAAFADRINGLSSLSVSEAKDGERILPGHVYIAPGDQHLIVEFVDKHYRCSLNNGLPVNRHKPSVDVLFRSVAQSAGPNGIGVLLTGMGSDGAAGLLQMRQAKARTFVQDEETSVVWGMPGSAVKLGAADADGILPLDEIAGQLLGALKTGDITDRVKEFARFSRLKT